MESCLLLRRSIVFEHLFSWNWQIVYPDDTHLQWSTCPQKFQAHIEYILNPPKSFNFKPQIYFLAQQKAFLALPYPFNFHSPCRTLAIIQHWLVITSKFCWLFVSGSSKVTSKWHLSSSAAHTARPNEMRHLPIDSEKMAQFRSSDLTALMADYYHLKSLDWFSKLAHNRYPGVWQNCHFETHQNQIVPKLSKLLKSSNNMAMVSTVSKTRIWYLRLTHTALLLFFYQLR